MQKLHNVSKRVLTMILTMTILLSAFSSTLAFAAAALNDEKDVAKTDGEIIAENYDLTENEKELLKSGYLIGATHNYDIPDASDDLISVDIDRKIITAKSFKGADGYIWNPVKIEIIENNNVTETITAIEDNQARYTTDADAFAVKVAYEVKHTVNEANQALLLNAADILKSGVDSMEAVLDPDGTFQTALALFMELSTMPGAIPSDSYNPNASTKGALQLLLEDGYTVGVFGRISFQDTLYAGSAEEGIEYTEVAAVAALFSQLNAYGGKLAIQVLADEYAAAPSKIKFLSENAERIYSETVNIYNYLYALTADRGCLMTILDLMDINLPGFSVSENIKTGIKAYINSITSIVGDKNNTDGVVTVAKVGCIEPYCQKDAWKILTSNPIKSGLTDLEYKALDILVGTLGDDIKGATASVKNPLIVDTTSIQYNMSMYDVDVKVTLKVVEDRKDSAALVEYDTVTVKLTLAQNATASEISEAIEKSLVEANAKNKWAGVYVDGQFDRTADVIPSILTGDLVYNITYTPKTYDFTSSYGAAAKLPYGYQLTLPVHADIAQAYDYTVNGTYYAQGSVVVVMGDLEITRTAGKSYTSYTINDIVANNFFANNKTASDILTSGALKLVLGNTPVDVRMPDENDGLVTLRDNEISAKKYASSYKGIDWMPYAYTVVSGTDAKTYYFAAGAESATVASANFDRIEVVYRLDLGNIAGVQEVINLPALLVSEAASQIAALDKLNAYYGAMEEIASNKTIILSLNTFIDADTEADEATKTKLKNAITGLTSECFDGNTLKMYALMTNYRADGLVYYYQNSGEFHKEIETLNKYLEIIGEETDILRRIVASVREDAVEYVDKIDTIGTAIAQLKADLKAPNAAIDLASANLEKLTNILVSATSISTPAAKPLYIESDTFTVNAGDKVTVSVKVQGNTASSVTFAKEHVITDADIDKIIAAVEQKIAELNYADRYYDSNYSRAVLKAMVGKTVEDLDATTINFTFVLKNFKVEIDGASDAIINLENLKIELPKSNSTVYRYEYVIFDKVVSADKYTFTAEEFEKIIDQGTYFIKRNVVDIQREEYTSFVNDLNAAVGNDRIVFALVENDSGYSIIMKMDISDPNALTDAIMGLSMELVSYGYVAFDSNAMIYGTENGPKVSIQALIDTVLESGFGTDTFVDMINANGTINNMKMPGEVISDKKIQTAGAPVAQPYFYVGNSSDDITYQVPMYITVGAVQPALVSVRNLFANKLAPYFSVKCEDGEINVDITLPKIAYEAYLAVLIVTDNIDITNVNAINEQIALGFLEDVIRPIMQSDASMKSVQNTLAKFGFDIDLTGYEDAFEFIRESYNNRLFAYDEEKSTYDAIIDINIGGYLDRLGALGNMIAEKDTGIKTPISASLVNLDKTYEALYLDINMSGSVNGFGLTEDVRDTLSSVTGTAVVILLDDIDGNLVFKTTTLLNLNGCTVNGDLVAKGQVSVIDTSIDENNVGAVTGRVSGNVTLTGGKYNANVAAYIPEGYEQTAEGEVINTFIDIVRDEKGNITAKLNANAIALRSIPDLKSLALDIVAELLVNGLSTNRLYLDGNKVYDLTIEDLVGIYTAPNRVEALSQKLKAVVDIDALINIINMLLDDITDFDAISAALNADIANGIETPIVSYELTTGAWSIEFDYVEEDDSITLGVGSHHENTVALDIVVCGDNNNKQYIADVMNLLADTTDVNIKLAGGVSKNGSTIVANVALSANVTVDFSGDTKYAVLFSTIIADGIGNSANKELVAGLEDFFNTQDTAKLEAAFNKITVNQIITAAKKFTNAKTFAGMLNNIGLGAYYDEDAAKLEEDIDALGVIIGKLLAKAEIDGPAIAIGNFLDSQTNAYTVDKEDIEKSFATDLFGGYGIEINVAVDEAFASVKVFGDRQPVEPPVDVIDYSALKAEIAKIEAEKLNQDKYTVDSWIRLANALNMAKRLIGNATTQAEVDEMLSYLRFARAGLQEKGTPIVGLDYSALQALIATIEAENLDAALYTEESWVRFDTILAMAKGLIGKATTQAEVDFMVVQLKSARAGLVLKGEDVVIDYSALQTLIAAIEAEQLVADKYTADSWAAFETVFAAAKNLVGKATAQAEVDLMVTQLQAARAALVEKSEPVIIDYSALEAEIAKIEAENLEAAKYTADSWETFQATLAAAKNLIGKATTQAQVDEILAQLKAARAGLVEKTTPVVPNTVNYAALLAAIERAEALESDDYTTDSWKAMVAALDAARAALNSNDQATVDKAAKALNDAIDALEEKSSTVWLVVVLGSVGALGLVGAASFVVIRKKKKMLDSTPLVDYNIDEDNVDGDAGDSGDDADDDTNDEEKDNK